MVWQVIVVVLTFLFCPLVVLFANHTLQRRRERNENQRKEHNDMVARQKRACGDLLDGAQQYLLTIALAADHRQSLMSMLFSNGDNVRKAAEKGIARIQQAGQVLKVEPGTDALNEAAAEFCRSVGVCFSAIMAGYPRPLSAEVRAKQDAILQEKLTVLKDAVRSHLESLAQPSAPPPRRWWHRQMNSKSASATAKASARGA